MKLKFKNENGEWQYTEITELYVSPSGEEWAVFAKHYGFDDAMKVFSSKSKDEATAVFHSIVTNSEYGIVTIYENGEVVI